jgi:rhodanese-related sulfurtransferase
MLSIFLTVALALGPAAPAKARQQPNTPVDAAAVPRLSQPEFQKLHSTSDVLVIDVRSEAIFQEGHIPGAIGVPLAEIEDRIDAIRSQAKSRQIVTYCSCPAEYSAAAAAVILYRHGFKKVSALVGGFPDWVAAGGRVEKRNAGYFSAAASSARNFLKSASDSTVMRPAMR